ncbi:universal stress protein in QAH/OAS sulfhydrylase 3'region-like [Salvia hispanica]|uniref:universal stress protein in QAH/OAS sulfhydrylase 3'region-like n=1 Tax=Salvia hispanica TaxID=49212 RepID=UPI002008F9A9|nr:universal stress protein in QAH/OAS sulfhydrylase 3'region-like [Salvia hispanica]
MEKGIAEAFSSIPEGGGTAAIGAEEKKKVRVMVAIDDSGESFYSLQWVLDHVFGSRNNDEFLLSIVHVIEPFPTYMLPGAPAVFPSTSIVRSVNKAQEENASAILSRAIDMCTQTNQDVHINTSIIEGDPKEMICDLAEQMQVDLIVIGSRGLGKIKRALMGSVSNYVIHHAKCPVLVVKTPTTKSMSSNA